MATVSSPPATGSQRGVAPAIDGAAPAPRQALVPAPLPPQIEAEPAFHGLVPQLPVELDVAVPVREFRMRHLLALAPGQVIESKGNHGEDLPLSAGEVQIAWSEFEVVETQLAVRVTRLA